MGVSDEERRKVAARMREYDVSAFKESAIVPFLDCLGAGYKDWRDILAELADLIDRPTCRLERVSQSTLKCTSCGNLFDCYTIGGGDDYQAEWYRFCPWCGAEVVNDD